MIELTGRKTAAAAAARNVGAKCQTAGALVAAALRKALPLTTTTTITTTTTTDIKLNHILDINLQIYTAMKMQGTSNQQLMKDADATGGSGVKLFLLRQQQVPVMHFSCDFQISYANAANAAIAALASSLDHYFPSRPFAIFIVGLLH
ncbi:unnamed protein product [Ceratitis capitata]|uniref:(Mediterranean fruit fly) hypothetical protein n=1 Tax=Ceratitis capitata TaxID=7213 RepID=A0A811V1Z3_CERCA|nr:unnamed protein product [Ceratitis capitata]